MSIIWWLQILLSLLYPIVGPIFGNSLAAAIPFLTVSCVSVVNVLIYKQKLEAWVIVQLPFLFMTTISSILHVNVIMLAACIKTFGWIPIYSVFVSTYHARVKQRIFSNSTKLFFFIALLICSFPVIELASRIYEPASYLVEPYLQYLGHPGLGYRRYGELSGFFSGSYVLGFYSDVHTGAGLSVITFTYFLYRRQQWLMVLALIEVTASMSTTSLITALVILLVNRINIVSIRLLKRLVLINTTILAFNFAFSGRLWEKVYGNSFRTILEQIIDGISILNFQDILFGIGYGHEGATPYKESSIVEYIYMTGISSLLSLIFAVVLLYKAEVTNKIKSYYKHDSKIKRRHLGEGMLHSVIIIVIYFGLLVHYNQLLNPICSLAFVLLLCYGYYRIGNDY